MIVSDYIIMPRRTIEEAKADQYKQDLTGLCLAIDCSFEAAGRALVELGTDDGDPVKRLGTYTDALFQILKSVWKARDGVKLP